MKDGRANAGIPSKAGHTRHTHSQPEWNIRWPIIEIEKEGRAKEERPKGRHWRAFRDFGRFPFPSKLKVRRKTKKITKTKKKKEVPFFKGLPLRACQS